MTDNERAHHLTQALDALTQARETFDLYAYTMPPGACRTIRHDLLTAKASIEAAAMAKPSVLRRWFGRTERRERAA